MGIIGSIAGGLTSAVGGALAAKARNKDIMIISTCFKTVCNR